MGERVWYTLFMDKKQQGDIGVAAAIYYYTKSGAVVSIPNTDNARYDLVVDFDGKLTRVQVKTTGYKEKNSYIVQLRTAGGNRSWGGTVKKLDSSEFDELLVYTMEGSVYTFPAEFVHDRSTITLSDKYASYAKWLGT